MDNIVKTRFEGLVETIDYYLWLVFDGHKLSKEQIKQLKEAFDTICCFGEVGEQWHDLAQEIL